MRRPIRTAVLLAIVALLANSALAFAQYAGGRSAQRGFYSEDVGIVGPPAMPPGIAAIVLARAAELTLTDSQRLAIESVHRMQDSVNTPRLAKLDSTRPTRLPAGGPKDLSPEQREEADMRRAVILPLLDAIRATNVIARQRVMAELNAAQQKRVEKLEDDARKNAEKEGRRRMEEGRLPFVMPEESRGRPPEG